MAGGGARACGRVSARVYHQVSSTLFLETERGDYGLARLGWSVSSRHPPIPLLVLGLQMHHGTRLLHGY